ncbi:MAG: DegV family protein [Clostridia bacterium]|nr:DegV family protein [Clostridia bacterium]
MQKVKVSTDSTADIPARLRGKLEIGMVPMTIITDEREYLDSVDMQPAEFYELLAKSDKLPTTSQVRNTFYTELFEEAWRDGYTDLVHVSINGKGSGTFQAGMMSRDLFYEEHPEAKDSFNIHLIDSGTYSMAYGWAVVEAAQKAQQGVDVAEIIAFAEDWLANVRILFVPLTLKYVKKSGRVSAAAAFVGDALGLKPIITFEDGESKVLTKVRGEAKTMSAVLDMAKKEKKPGTPYMLVYGSAPEAYAKFKKMVVKEFGKPELEYPVGSVISLNSGPDIFAIIYRK